MIYDEAYDEFDHFLDTVETLADNTRRGYMCRCDRFLAYLVELGHRDTTAITADLVADFMVDAYASLGDNTYNLYVVQIRRFLAFLRQEGELGDDVTPERKLKSRRRPQPKKTKKFVYADQVEGYALKAREWHVRDEYAIRLTFGFARRAYEICAMSVGDVDLEPRGNARWGVFRFIDAKSRKPAFLPIQEQVEPYVRRWLEIYAEAIGRDLEPGDPLFPAIQRGKGRNYRGQRHPMVMNPAKPLPRDSMGAIMERAGVPGSHPLRRGALVDLKERHGIRVAKTYADHSSEVMTERYMDESREVDDLGRLLIEESEAKAERPAETFAPAGVVSLADRRARSAGAARGA